MVAPHRSPSRHPERSEGSPDYESIDKSPGAGDNRRNLEGLGNQEHAVRGLLWSEGLCWSVLEPW
jgi:hypothetical protein